MPSSRWWKMRWCVVRVPLSAVRSWFLAQDGRLGPTVHQRLLQLAANIRPVGGLDRQKSAFRARKTGVLGAWEYLRFSIPSSISSHKGSSGSPIAKVLGATMSTSTPGLPLQFSRPSCLWFFVFPGMHAVCMTLAYSGPE